MKKWICAKDVTSLAVIELMYGKKTKVAVKTENGNFEVQTKSIIEASGICMGRIQGLKRTSCS